MAINRNEIYEVYLTLTIQINNLIQDKKLKRHLFKGRIMYFSMKLTISLLIITLSIVNAAIKPDKPGVKAIWKYTSMYALKCI